LIDAHFISIGHEKKDRDIFSVGHFAGNVAYSVQNWLEKNRDTLNIDLVKVLKTSTKDLIRELFLEPLGTLLIYYDIHFLYLMVFDLELMAEREAKGGGGDDEGPKGGRSRKGGGDNNKDNRKSQQTNKVTL
jgi:hypothetical protein